MCLKWTDLQNQMGTSVKTSSFSLAMKLALRTGQTFWVTVTEWKSCTESSAESICKSVISETFSVSSTAQPLSVTKGLKTELVVLTKLFGSLTLTGLLMIGLSTKL